MSEHSTGTAMDIGAINGVVITPATQGPGSITDLTIQSLLKLQGTMKPHQIISLMTFDGADNTFAMGDHDDHIHVGWRPLYGQNRRAARQIDAVLKPEQWIKLIDRLGDIDNPTVRAQPSRFSTKVVKRSSRALTAASSEPLRPGRVGQPVDDDRAEHDERGEVEDALALGDRLTEDEDRERHRRHALGAEPGHEGLGGGVDPRAGERDPDRDRAARTAA